MSEERERYNMILLAQQPAAVRHYYLIGGENWLMPYAIKFIDR